MRQNLRSQAERNHDCIMTITHLDIVDSTHHYCQLLDLQQLEELALFWADFQTAGIGQRGNRWESQKGKNLTFSFILHPSFLAPAHQYRLTEALALGVVDWLQPLLPSHRVYIKWPNDIYVGHSKICGMLNEAHLGGSRFSSAIASIGLNVNQTSFPEWVPNPVSLKQLSGFDYHLEECLHSVMNCIKQRYEQLKKGGTNDIHCLYLERLLQRGEACFYRYQGEVIGATITDVNSYGHLQLFTNQGQQISCQLKEITYIFPEIECVDS